MPTQTPSVFAPVSTLPAITKVAAARLSKTLDIKTIEDLSESPHFLFAAEIIDAEVDPGHILQSVWDPQWTNRQSLRVLADVE